MKTKHPTSGENSLSTTVFKGFDFIQCFNLVFQTQEINFRSKHFQMLISLYKVFVVCGEQSAHYYLLFALSNKFILEIENFCKNAVLKLRKFQKTVLQSGNCSKHAPDVGKSLPNWSSQSEMFKNETSNFKVYIFYFRNFVFFYFRENRKSRVPFSKQSAGKSSILRESSILSKFHF